MLFLFRSKKGSPYNIFGTILFLFIECICVFMVSDSTGFLLFLWITFMGGFPCLYIYETFWWWRYERATIHKKQAMIEKLARKKAKNDNSKNYIDYMNEFYRKYGHPVNNAVKDAIRENAIRENAIWEEAYRRATPEQKARMTKERNKQEAYKRLSPEEKQRRKEQEEFERKVQSTLNKY